MAAGRAKIIPFLFLLSCFHRSAVMTRQDFNTVEMGEPISTLEQRVGAPYTIRNLKNGGQEYEYIERITMGDEVIEENHYFIIVENGKIIGKRTTLQTPPAYDLIYEDDPNDTDLQ